MLTLLTVKDAAKRASERFRKVVGIARVHDWIELGLLKPMPEVKAVLIRDDHLEKFLDDIEDTERYLTMQEARARLEEKYGIKVARRTLHTWCEAGVKTADGTVLKLPRSRCPWFRANAWLIAPYHLDEFVKAVPNLGKVGRPLNGRREAVRKGGSRDRKRMAGE